MTRAILIPLLTISSVGAASAGATHGMVASVHPAATEAGVRVLKQGVMNNEMDDFSIQPGVKNYFGLVGGQANAIAPGKRPLSSMSPTLVLKDGQTVIALGAAGGPKILTQVAQELVCPLDLGMIPEKALAQPRIHHQWVPNELMVEKTLRPALRAGLAERRHKVERMPRMGVSQIVARRSDGRGFVGAADPRASGNAAGW